MKVKIVWVQNYTDDYDTKNIMRGVPEEDFEEITEEEYHLLRRNLHTFPRPDYGMEPKIVKLDEVPVVMRLSTIKEHIAKLEEKRLLDEVKRKERAAKIKKGKLEKERERYEAMKKKFEKGK